MKLDSKYFDRIRTRKNRQQEAVPEAPTCQWDGCDKPGAHRAPVGRNAEGQFFCSASNTSGNTTRATIISPACRTARSPGTRKRRSPATGRPDRRRQQGRQGCAASFHGALGCCRRYRHPAALQGSVRLRVQCTGDRPPFPDAGAQAEDIGGQSLRYDGVGRQCDRGGDQNPLQGTGQETSPGCERRRPRFGRTFSCRHSSISVVEAGGFLLSRKNYGSEDDGRAAARALERR